MNMNSLMQQAQRMQKELAKKQAELEEKLFEVVSSGGAIKVSIYGNRRIEKIDIDKDAIDPEDKEMLEDMIISAVNEALRKADDAAASSLKGITGGMSIPGLF